MRYTKEQIKDYLQKRDFPLDCDGFGKWSYCLHLDENGKLVDSRTDYGETFFVAARYIGELSDECNKHHPDDPEAASYEFWDRVFATEETEDFDDLVDQMTDIVNSYLEEMED